MNQDRSYLKPALTCIGIALLSTFIAGDVVPSAEKFNGAVLGFLAGVMLAGLYLIGTVSLRALAPPPNPISPIESLPPGPPKQKSKKKGKK